MASFGTDRGIGKHAATSSSSSSSSPSHIELFGKQVERVVPYHLGVQGDQLPNTTRYVMLSAGEHGNILMTEYPAFYKSLDIPSEADWEATISQSAQKDHKLIPLASFKDKNVVCQGYMAVNVTCELESWSVPTEETKWKQVKQTETRTLRFITVAHNILMTGKGACSAHIQSSPKNEGGQRHVEQICMFRMQGLLDALAIAGCKVTTWTGDVRFKGEMPSMCPACRQVANSLTMTEKLNFMKS